MSRTLAIALAVTLAAGALAGCGKQGDLDRPAPMWGDKAKAEYEAQQRAAAAAKHHSAPTGSPEALPPPNGAATNDAVLR